MENTGHFFVFEGIDGSGKSTQIRLLKEKIEELGVRCMETKEPTDGPIGSLVHQCMTGRTSADEYSIAALFAADRLDHLLNESDGLCGKIQDGITVLSDRFIFSTYAYQSVNIPLEWLIQMNSQATEILRPDCHIFIDVDPEVAMERITAGRFHTERYETTEQLTKVRSRYYQLFDRFQGQESVLIVDGNQSVDDIAKDIWQYVAPFYDIAETR
ncbi:MAG: dTMP kinase [Lachnospiraceae bacterium]|nr:dTMP kinase [Lachnospiraceae bacterium]